MDVLVHAGEGFRCNSDHGEIQTPEAHLESDDRRVTFEFLLPQFVRKNDYCIAPGDCILVGAKASAHVGLDAKHAEEISSHQQAHSKLGLGVGVSGKPGWHELESDKTFERTIFVSELHEIGIRERSTPEPQDRVLTHRYRTQTHYFSR